MVDIVPFRKTRWLIRAISFSSLFLAPLFLAGCEEEAEVVPEPERSQLYQRMASRNPGFAEYERRTERIIPVIRLTRALPRA